MDGESEREERALMSSDADFFLFAVFFCRVNYRLSPQTLWSLLIVPAVLYMFSRSKPLVSEEGSSARCSSPSNQHELFSLLPLPLFFFISFLDRPFTHTTPRRRFPSRHTSLHRIPSFARSQTSSAWSDLRRRLCSFRFHLPRRIHPSLRRRQPARYLHHLWLALLRICCGLVWEGGV